MSAYAGPGRAAWAVDSRTDHKRSTHAYRIWVPSWVPWKHRATGPPCPGSLTLTRRPPPASLALPPLLCTAGPALHCRELRTLQNELQIAREANDGLKRAMGEQVMALQGALELRDARILELEEENERMDTVLQVCVGEWGAGGARRTTACKGGGCTA